MVLFPLACLCGTLSVRLVNVIINIYRIFNVMIIYSLRISRNINVRLCLDYGTVDSDLPVSECLQLQYSSLACGYFGLEPMCTSTLVLGTSGVPTSPADPTILCDTALQRISIT